VTRVRSVRAVIADDEAGARTHLRALLAGCQVRTVAECETGGEILDVVARTGPDLLCLDIRMPGLDGIEVARRLAAELQGRAPRPVIVFTTGYPDYAPAAFEVEAADYLLKPLTAARVADAIRRVRLRLAGPAARVPRLFLPDGDHRAALAPEAIRFVEAKAGASMVHAEDGLHVVRAPLARFELVLVPHGFMRTHRAYLVNLRRVRALIPWSRHVWSLLVDDGKETHVPVAKSRLAALRRTVIWIGETGGLPDGPGVAGQGGHRGRGQPRAGPGDR
jgi:DNA-binding LytR/AlgR family response regulator